MTTHWKAVENYFTVVFQVYPVLGNVLVLDLTLSEVKEFKSFFLDKETKKTKHCSTAVILYQRSPLGGIVCYVRDLSSLCNHI